jgi:hypothetical protein
VRKLTSFIALALFAGAAATNAHAVGASSSFDANADGWFISNYDGTDSAAANWTNGVIQTDDKFGETSFHAPTKFNGDWSSLYGSTLSFDLTETGRDANAGNYYTAIIASGTNVLYWYGGAPTTEFTTFVASLAVTDSRWRLGGTGFDPTTGVAPNAAQFQSVLSNVTRIQVNAEFITGADNSRLDNVILGPVPEPETYAMLLAGLGLMGALARRRKQKSMTA